MVDDARNILTKNHNNLFETQGSYETNFNIYLNNIEIQGNEYLHIISLKRPL